VKYKEKLCIKYRMNRNVSAQISYDRLAKGVDIRDASTANFLIDSTDRQDYNNQTVYIPGVSPTIFSSDFLINKSAQNLVTGFFTRFALTEIELAWNIQNVSSTIGNNSCNVIIVQASPAATYILTSVTIANGNYNVAEGLTALTAQLNIRAAAAGITGGASLFTLSASTVAFGKQILTCSAGFTFNFYRTDPATNSPNGVPNLDLAQSLGFLVYNTQPTSAQTTFSYNIAYNPNLLAYEYIDICCSQIASQQKLKDATTSSYDTNDVIYRFNFSSDASYPATFDALGYPILPGYKPFNIRRYLAFPKQIRWDPLLPLGQMQIQVYTDKQQILKYRYLAESVEFKMLMLISEV